MPNNNLNKKIAPITALKHPIRVKILENARLKGQISVAELGRIFGERTSYIAYHVAQLQEAGLLIDCGKRTAHHRAERVFELREPAINLAGTAQRTEVVQDLLKFAKDSLRRAGKELENAADGPEAGQTTFIRWVFPATKESRRKIAKALDLLRSAAQEQTGDDHYSLTLALVPVSRES